MKPKDSARRLVWWIVAVIAGVMGIGVLLSHREAGERSAAASAALEDEEVRVARQTRERAKAEKMRQIEDTHRRNLQWLESQEQALENRERLNAAIRARLRAEFELEQEQKRAAR
jgi:hypothetical protein